VLRARAVSGGYKAWTVSDHVREMHALGASPERIVQVMGLKPETVEKWLDTGDKGL